MGAMLFSAFAGTSNLGDKIVAAVATQEPFHGRTPHLEASETGDGSEPVPVSNLFVPTLEVLRRMRIPWTGIVRFGAFWMSQLRKFFPDQLIHLLFNLENIRHEDLKRATVRIVERIGPQVLAQFMDRGLSRH